MASPSDSGGEMALTVRLGVQGAPKLPSGRVCTTALGATGDWQGAPDKHEARGRTWEYT